MSSPQKKNMTHALTMPEHLKKALAGEVSEPQLSVLVGAFFQVAGGPKAMAKMLHDEYHASKPGSMVRQRILAMILNATRFTNERQQAKDDLGLVSEADLEKLGASILGRLSEETSDGDKRDPEPGPQPAKRPKKATQAAGQASGPAPAPAP